MAPNAPGILGRLNRAMLAGKEEAIEVFNSHVAEVKAHVPANRLLVFDVRDGWAPLCEFLDRPAPEIPFSLPLSCLGLSLRQDNSFWQLSKSMQGKRSDTA